LAVYPEGEKKKKKGLTRGNKILERLLVSMFVNPISVILFNIGGEFF
jgi:hypothetical protein